MPGEAFEFCPPQAKFKAKDQPDLKYGDQDTGQDIEDGLKTRFESQAEDGLLIQKAPGDEGGSSDGDQGGQLAGQHGDWRIETDLEQSDRNEKYYPDQGTDDCQKEGVEQQAPSGSQAGWCWGEKYFLGKGSFWCRCVDELVPLNKIRVKSVFILPVTWGKTDHILDDFLGIFNRQ